MPARKKSNLSPYTKKCRKRRLARSRESEYEREQRLAAAQEYQSRVRASKTSSHFQQVVMLIAAGLQTDEAQDALIARECRACLQKIDTSLHFYNVFQAWDPIPPWNELGGTISDDLTKLAGIQLSATDRYSKLICGGCCMKLHSACQFIFTVKKNDQVLQERYVEVSVDDKTWPKPIQLEKSINGALINTMDVDIKQEVLSEDEYGTTGVDEAYQPDLDIKIEPEEILGSSTIKVTVNDTITPEDMKADNPVKENGRAIYENEEAAENAHNVRLDKIPETKNNTRISKESKIKTDYGTLSTLKDDKECNTGKKKKYLKRDVMGNNMADRASASLEKNIEENMKENSLEIISCPKRHIKTEIIRDEADMTISERSIEKSSMNERAIDEASITLNNNYKETEAGNDQDSEDQVMERGIEEKFIIESNRIEKESENCFIQEFSGNDSRCDCGVSNSLEPNDEKNIKRLDEEVIIRGSDSESDNIIKRKEKRKSLKDARRQDKKDKVLKRNAGLPYITRTGRCVKGRKESSSTNTLQS